MTNVNQTAQEAVDAMLLQQSAVQLAQVQYNNSKLSSENKLSLYFLQEFQKACKDMQDKIDEQDKKKEEMKTLQDWLKVVSVVGAVLACALGQPEIAALIIVTTSLSMIPSGEKDKNGNSLSVMDEIVNSIASKLPGGDTAANKLWVTLGITVVLTVLTCGAGGLMAASGSRALAELPLVLVIALGGTGFVDKLTTAIEEDKAALANFTTFINWTVGAINTCGGDLQLPSKDTVKLILTVMIASVFIVASLGAGIYSMKQMGTAGTVLGMVAQRFTATSRAAVVAATSAEEAAEVATASVATVGRGVEASAWCFDEAAENVARIAADEGTELLEVASAGSSYTTSLANEIRRGVEETGSLTAEAVQSGIRGATNCAASALGRSLTRMAGFMRNFGSWINTHPVSAITGVVTLGYIVNAAIGTYKDLQLVKNYMDQADLIVEQGVFGREKTDSSFQLKLINMISDNDSKVLKTQWQGDAALQETFSHFSDDAKAIANALLG